jgi:hypothetical protein
MGANKQVYRGFLMNRYQKFLILSIVFLAISLIVPIYALYNALTSNLSQYITTLPTLQEQPYINDFFARLSADQQNLLIILIVVEAVFVVLFAATLWYAIKCRDRCRNFPNP